MFVVGDAARRLHCLESSPRAMHALPDHQVDLFAATNPVIEELRGIEPDELTPRAALELLYRWRTLLK